MKNLVRLADKFAEEEGVLPEGAMFLMFPGEKEERIVFYRGEHFGYEIFEDETTWEYCVRISGTNVVYPFITNEWDEVKEFIEREIEGIDFYANQIVSKEKQDTFLWEYLDTPDDLFDEDMTPQYDPYCVDKLEY